MKRSRVQRPFTVEIKSRNRQTGSLQDQPSVPSPAVPSGLWAGLNLQGDLIDRPETPPPSEAEAPRKVEPRAPEPEKRRVLPSLLAPAPEPVETDAAPTAEPRLPRVRRVAAKPRPQAQPAWAEALAEPDAPAPRRSGIVVPSAQSAPEASDRSDSELGASELALARLRRERRGLPGLRAGERWKRRLPRSCW
jgi:hypothetical protein